NAPGNYTPTAPASIQKYMQEKRAEREAMRRPPAELTPYFEVFDSSLKGQLRRISLSLGGAA
ncbi:MAG: hypothetical protein ACKO4S_09720, partial [Snowella sp.]